MDSNFLNLLFIHRFVGSGPQQSCKSTRQGSGFKFAKAFLT